MRFGLILIFTSVAWACSTNSPLKVGQFDRQPKEIIQKNGVSVEVYDFEGFKPFLSQDDGRIHVVNFWATWCIPCVKELPYFESLQQKYPEIKVLLVSLDFYKQIEGSLIPFIKKNQLNSEVIVLDDPDGNRWIPQVSEDWSGAIPATVIYKDEKKKFYEQSFNFEELEQAVQDFQ